MAPRAPKQAGLGLHAHAGPYMRNPLPRNTTSLICSSELLEKGTADTLGLSCSEFSRGVAVGAKKAAAPAGVALHKVADGGPGLRQLLIDRRLVCAQQRLQRVGVHVDRPLHRPCPPSNLGAGADGPPGAQGSQAWAQTGEGGGKGEGGVCRIERVGGAPEVRWCPMHGSCGRAAHVMSISKATWRWEP